MTRPRNNGRITREELMQRLSYDGATGIFTWRETKWDHAVGDVAGYNDGRGYVRIVMNGCAFPAHRLAWLYTYSEWPPDQIDHINGARSDNRICNLRTATSAQNNAAKGLTSQNKSGYKGVSWNIKKKRWQVYIRVNGKNKFLGHYDDAKTGGKVYAVAANAYHGPFANMGRKI